MSPDSSGSRVTVTSNNRRAKTAEPKKGLQREVPPGLIIGALALVLIALGAGIFHFLNGGWKTQAQQQEYFTHTYIPSMRIMQGDKKAWVKENARRKKEGLPALPSPESDPN